MRSLLSCAAALSMLAAAAFARAEGLPTPPLGVVNLSSSASVEVVRDLLSVALSVTREGTDAGAVQSQLKQALDAVLTEAKKAVKPNQLEVQTGNFSLSPRYSNKGGISGWVGTAELLIEGRDMQAIGALTGRINTMTISRLGYSLSRELREKVEGDVAAQAIARYRAKAADYAKQFGYSGYAVREVSVNTGEPVGFSPVPMMRAKAMSVASDESLPVEPGKGAVTVTVNGTVQMNR